MTGKGALTFYVRDFSGRVAATRHKGRLVASHIERLAADVPLIEINFEGVEIATAPFMDEVVREVRALKDKAIYSCLNEDVGATLTFVENRMADRG